MARKRIYDEDLRLNVIINGKGLEKGNKKLIAELGKQERKMRELEMEGARLQKRYDEVVKAQGRKSASAVALKKSLNAVNSSIRAQQAVLKGLRNEIGLAGMTLQQLNNHLKALKVELNNSRGSKAFTQKLRKEIRQTEMEIVKLRTGASKLAQTWERVALQANKFGTMIGYAMIAIMLLSQSIGKVVHRMKDLEDRIGAVRKLAKLSRDQVWELKVAFDELGTRTKTDKLLDMAKIAGRLGVEGHDNILRFVSAADKIGVALKESLGDNTEEIMRKMGKLVNVFRLTDNMSLDTAITRIGSVLNELDKRSAASAESILEYTYRLSSYAEVVNLSSTDVMGLAASLDALGVRAEMGSTQILKLFRGIGKSENAAQFARVIGVTADEYERLAANDPNELFLKLLEMFGSQTGNMIEMEQLMQDFGVDGQRLVQVLGPLINNLDKVREQQAIANEEFIKGTSVLKEFEIMNSTFGASIDIQTKRLRSMTDLLYKKMEPAVLKVYTRFIDFTVAIKNIKNWLVDHARILKTALAVYIALKAPVIYRISLMATEMALLRLMVAWEAISVGWKKLSVLWTGKLTVAQGRLLLSSKTLAVAYLLLHGRFKKALTMLKAMAVGTSAVGVAIFAATAAILAIAAAIYILTKRTTGQSEAQKQLAELQKTTANNIGEEKGALDRLFSTYENAENKQKARAELIKILNSEYGEYLGYMIDEKNEMFDLTKAYDDISKAMGDYFELKNARELHDKMGGKMGELQAEIEPLERKKSLWDADAKKSFDKGDMGAYKYEKNTSKFLGRKLAKLKSSNAEFLMEYENLQKRINQLQQKQEERYEKFKKVNLTNREYETDLDKLKLAQKDREAILTERALNEKKSSDWLNDQKLKSDITYYKKKKELDEKMGGEEAILEDRIAIANAYIQLRNNQAKADKNSGKDTDKILKEQADNIEELHGGLQTQEAARLHRGEIDRQQYDRNHLRLEIAKLESLRELHIQYGADIAEIDAKLFTTRESYANMDSVEEAEYEKIKLAREQALEQEILDLTERYIDEKDIRENFGQYVLDAELALLNTLRQARLDLGLGTLELDRMIADKRKQGYDDQVQDAQSFAKHLDSVLGKRDKNYINKLIRYNKEIRIAQEDTALSAEEKEGRIAMLKQRLGEANEAEALSWATSAQSAVDGAETHEEATAAVLNMIRQKISAYLAEAVAGAIAHEVGSKGLAGIALGAAAAAAVAVLFSTLIPKFSVTGSGNITASGMKSYKKTHQLAKGQYPVKGADDGLLYDAVYRGPVKTGIYGQPTLLDMAGGRTLVGETKLPELVIDGNTFAKMRMNSPQLVKDIYTVAGKVPQYAGGNYPAMATPGVFPEDKSAGEDAMLEKLDKLIDVVGNMKVYADIQEIDKKLKNMKKIQTESKMS